MISIDNLAFTRLSCTYIELYYAKSKLRTHKDKHKRLLTHHIT